MMSVEGGSLLELCRREEIDQLLDLLRWGPFLSSDGHCRLPEPDALAGVSWLRMVRMPPPNQVVEGPHRDLINALAGASSGFVVAASGSPQQNRLLIGIRDPSLQDWLKSILAPSVIFEQAEPPDFFPLAEKFVGGLSYRLYPGVLGDKSKEANATAFERLMLLTGLSWCVLMDVEPISAQAIEQLLADLELSQSELAQIRSRQLQRTPTETAILDRPDVELVYQWIEALHDLASTARAIGGWMVTTHVAATDGWGLNMAGGALATSLGDQGVEGGRWICDRLGIDPNAPLPKSLLSSRELSMLLQAPRRTVPGLDVSPTFPSDRDRIAVTKPIAIGNWYGLDEVYRLSIEDLEGHAFVAGITGTGKTTTVQRLLSQLWNDHGIPFLVVDPVKSDYEKMVRSLRGGLQIVDVGALRLNALEPASGFDERTHLEMVAAAFKGSFSMPPPVPYVVTHLFELVGDRAGQRPRPTLHDLSRLADGFIRSLGYDSEIESNIRAALVNRLRILVAPAKAERLAAPSNSDLSEWLIRPTIIQLSSIGDDEERSFIMALITILVGESARVAAAGEALRHVTVLEEAHRILPEPKNVGVSEWAGDPESVAARLLGQMLTEIRSYGEGVVVVDQSPSSVAREVVKNTNTRIAHRVLDPDDRELLGGSLGLAREATLGMSRLPRGVALVATRRTAAPHTVQIHPAPDIEEEQTPVSLDTPSSRDPRPCCRGVMTETHHRSELRAEEAESIMSGPVTSALVDPERAFEFSFEVARADLQRLMTRDPQLDQRCLAWIGIRASLSSHAELGNIDAAQLGRLVSHAYEAWVAGESFNTIATLLSQRTRRTFGPYAGCSFCEYKCRFRQFARCHRLFGRDNALTALQTAAVESRGRVATQWITSAQESLSDLFGPDAAGGAATCAVVHALEGINAPWHTYVEVFGTGMDRSTAGSS